MPIGRPDWYNKGQSNVVDTMQDSAELAVRLGSPVNYDRSGKTIFYDVFERMDGFYAATNNGGISDFALASTYAEYGGNSLAGQLNIGITNWIDLDRTFRLWGGKYLSCEIALATDYVPDQINFGLNAIYNGFQHFALIQLSSGIDVFEVYASPGSYQTFQTFSATQWPTNLFNVLRIIYDVEIDQWVSFSLNDKDYGLSAYDNHISADASAHRFLFSLTVYGHSTQALNAYLDRIIISEDL